MHRRHRFSRPRRERGVVMLFGLIALVIMLIGTVAMVRSMNTSLFNAGNMGFKRDLTNQGERAVSTVLTLLQSGALGTEASRQASNVARNYSATMLAANAQGVPNALIDPVAFAGVASAANDITVAGQGITIRYVIDRLCQPGTVAASATNCIMSDNGQSNACSSNPCDDLSDAVPQQAVYRLSVRVTGPRQTQAYFQTTLTL
jgi:hypothetical protein